MAKISLVKHSIFFFTLYLAFILQVFILFPLLVLEAFLFWGPDRAHRDHQFRRRLELASQSDVIIIFNPGGWGLIPFWKAKDFNEILRSVSRVLRSWNYKPAVVSYVRARDGIRGKLWGAREFFHLFRKRTSELAVELEEFIRQNPDKKIIIAGLSLGAMFTDATMEKISEKVRHAIVAIEAGLPFWKKPFQSEAVLRLNNMKADALSEGRIFLLLLVFFRAIGKWTLMNVSGERISIAEALAISGHSYSWSKTKPDIMSFLEHHFVPSSRGQETEQYISLVKSG